jgi:hypothetical protein
MTGDAAEEIGVAVALREQGGAERRCGERGSGSPFIWWRRKGRGHGEAVGRGRWPAAINGMELG